MTEKKMTTEELVEYYFGPVGHVEPDQSHPDALKAAHDYAIRNISPSVGTIADRLEAAFLAGTQWKPPHDPIDRHAQKAIEKARAGQTVICAVRRDDWPCTLNKGHKGPHVATIPDPFGSTVCDIWEEEQ